MNRLPIIAVLAFSVQVSLFDAVANDAMRATPTARASFVGAGMEANTNRSGSDYHNFDAPAAEQCQAACTNDGRCKAWTWVVPGGQGPGGRCWLKHAVPPPSRNQSCCVSGLSAHAAAGTALAKPMPQIPAKAPISPSQPLAQRRPAPEAVSRRAQPSVDAPNLGVPPRQRVLGSTGVSPSALDFGRMWGGDVHQRSVMVTPPASALAGNVRIELESGKVFSIAEIRVLGDIGDGTSISTSNQTIAPGGHARLSLDSTRIRISPSAPLSDVNVRRGETIVVTVKASPVMDQLKNGSFDGSGPYHSMLKLKGYGWQASVPVSVGVEGQRLGVVAHIESPTQPICQPGAYVPSVGDRRPVRVTLSNRQGRSADGKVELADLSPGFQPDQAAGSRTFSLTAGQSTSLELPMLLYWKDVHLPATGPEGSAAAGTYGNSLKIFEGGSFKVARFDVTVLPSQRIYRLKGEDGLEWHVDWRILCDGRWNANWNVFNPNIAVRREYMLDILWRGKRLARLSGTVGRVQKDVRTYSPEPLASSFVKSDYGLMLLEPPIAQLSYKNLP